jgi:hypothetical protein
MAKHESAPAYERLGAKVLTLPDVIAQSVGFMGPVFSSAFVIPLVIGFASTFVNRASRSASSELSDLTKSTA